MRRCSVILIVWLALLSPLCAQDEEPRTIPFDGPEVFCHILNETGLKTVASLNERMDPKTTMIVVFGYRVGRKLDEIGRATKGVDRFLADGGSLLVATDYRLNAASLPIRITGQRVQREGKLAYGGNEQCPWIAYPGQADAAASVGHPLFHLVTRGIATNCPSHVEIIKAGENVVSLLEYPITLDGRWCPSYMAGANKDAAPEGRALYIAGHGMFMNGMMLQQNNDNFVFAVNAVRWLREGLDGTQRTHALFIVDGEIITNFDADLSPRLPPIPLPPVRKLDRLLRGIEEEGIIPRILAENLDMDRTVAVCLAILTFGLLVYGAKKFMECRYLPETGVPLAVGPRATANASAPIISQRMDALIRKNHLGAIARSAVYEWFHEHAASTPDRCDLHVEASAPRRRELVRQVDFVLRLAHAGGAIRVTRGEFHWLVESLAQLEQAVREKHVLLLVDGKNVRQSPAT